MQHPGAAGLGQELGAKADQSAHEGGREAKEAGRYTGPGSI